MEEPFACYGTGIRVVGVVYTGRCYISDHTRGGAATARGRLTTPSFKVDLVVAPTFTTNNATIYDVVFLEESGARITCTADYVVKPGILIFSKVALYLYRFIGNQKSCAFGPVHAEEAKISAIEEFIVCQIYGPHIFVINISKHNEMILLWNMLDNLAAIQIFKLLYFELNSTAMEAQVLCKLLHCKKICGCILFTYQLYKLLVSNILT